MTHSLSAVPFRPRLQSIQQCQLIEEGAAGSRFFDCLLLTFFSLYPFPSSVFPFVQVLHPLLA